MRHIAIVVTLSLLIAVPTFGQNVPAPQQPYGLDPFKPTDAAFLRNWGATLVAQTPLLEMTKLDPYNPSHAALVRQIGGAMPIWGLVWYPGGPGYMPLAPLARTTAGSAEETFTAPGPNIGRFMSNPPLPPTNFDASKVGAFAALAKQQLPPTRVCRIRMGDREITC